MKRIKQLIIFGCSIFSFISCENVLDKYPLDKVTEEVFWKNAKDMELYSNKFYSCFPDHRKNDWNGGSFRDYNSDNEYMSLDNISFLNGKRTVPTNKDDNNWNWENIRAVNYFFENYEKVEADYESIRQFIGEMYFFKSWYYFNLLKRYGNLPWYDRVLSLDSEELYDPRVSRATIADSIIANLDRAIIHLQDKQSVPQDRFSRDLAIAFKARVCLYEGTWEKYHSGDDFGTKEENGERFLRKAVEAAETLMDGTYSLSVLGNGDPAENYRTLFIQSDYSSNSEILFWKKYNQELGYAHNLERNACYERGVTKSLIDSYLCKNGMPIYTSEGKNSDYQGDLSLEDVVKNRDPRLLATIFMPGDPRFINYATNDTLAKVQIRLAGAEKMPTGYHLKKGYSLDNSQNSLGAGITGAITIRYAEVLLIYAEAKAELGILNQSDLDKSINLLRSRVGMPSLTMEVPYVDPNWEFPQLSPIMNEIRRERRVELAFENFRNDDLMRWAAADELIVGKRPKGMRFVQELYLDIRPGIDVFVDNEGYLDPLQSQVPNGYGFNIKRDYLYPLPLNELVLNPNLGQNPGWSE